PKKLSSANKTQASDARSAPSKPSQMRLILALSRLARNNRDWHHLIDLCKPTDTLVFDGDGIYDPRQLNDRLLLGLKGTMSEFELGLLRLRGAGGAAAKE